LREKWKSDEVGERVGTEKEEKISTSGEKSQERTGKNGVISGGEAGV